MNKRNDITLAALFATVLAVSQAAEQPTGSGTAFFVTTDGYALTCYHVVNGAERIALQYGTTSRVARVVQSDSRNDLALLKVEGAFASLPLGESGDIQLGDGVAAIGYPNPDVQGTSPKLTKGEISSLVGFQDDPRLFQISAPIQPGNSGGPLLDTRGNVIGVTVASLDALQMLIRAGTVPQNVNYALKTAYALPLLSAARVRPTTQRARIEPVRLDYNKLAEAVCQVVVWSKPFVSHAGVEDSVVLKTGHINEAGFLEITIRNNNPFYVRNLKLSVSLIDFNNTADRRPPTFTWTVDDLIAPAQNVDVLIYHQTYSELFKLHGVGAKEVWHPWRVKVLDYDKVELE